MIIQDDLDKRLAPRSRLEVKISRDSLFYRAIDHNGMLVKNGFIGRDDLIKLRKMIDETLNGL